MSAATHQEIYLKDYQPSTYLIETVNLCIELAINKSSHTLVHAELAFKRRTDLIDSTVDQLLLQGEGLKLIQINNKQLSCDYELIPNGLVLIKPPEQFVLKTTVQIDPAANTALMGLYLSNQVFCTQCEAEGFRRITYFLDRPDVLASYQVKIIADKQRYPVLLSNGNLIETGLVAEQPDKHYAVWHDPFKKPCYLFALVAGDLAHLHDQFVTQDNKTVDLYIYADAKHIDQCHHAMQSLKKAMRWDEVNYGLAYDLERFNIVAVNDFVFGAMENKSLNIFNAKYILAKPETATDYDYAAIDTVVGHEYFHNWSGNRVTCRDWFQLSLKEGLTVFREHCFDEDNLSKTVHRIQKVQDLRNSQFQEDAGPMAHPVRPERYISIDNFYTRTVYNKGAELIRMLQLLLGETNYRHATEYYFQHFDGQAVTTDDFFAAMQRFHSEDLSQFKLWYSQAGTPTVNVTSDYDAATQRYQLTLQQSHERPMLIPIKLALLSPTGKHKPIMQLVLLNQQQQTIEFERIAEPVIPSLLQFFSAPVKLVYNYSNEELVFLMQHDNDTFNRWDAGQRYATRLITAKTNNMASRETYCQAFGTILTDNYNDLLLQAELLKLPSEQTLCEQGDTNLTIDLDQLIKQRDELLLSLALRFESDFLQLYHQLHTHEPYEYNRQQCGQRALKNCCLAYLIRTGKQVYVNLAYEQFSQAITSNMTDCLAALSALGDIDCLERVQALADFESQWQHEALVMNKWFGVQARSCLPSSLNQVKLLMQHDAFKLQNPNNIYALICGFAQGNLRNFHRINGVGYQFLAEQVILLDKINPMVAARAVEALINFKRFDVTRQALMRKQLKRIHQTADLSNNVYECVNRALQ